MEGSLTILVPVFNEEDCIPSFILRMNEFLDIAPLPSRVLFVNDGSTDGSAGLIKSACHHDTRYSAITLDRNRGLSTALKAGIDHCNSTFIGYIDADLQTSPADFLKLLEYACDYDLVTGYRVRRKDTVVKRASSLIANSFRRWLLEDNTIDNCCPLKVFRTEIARSMPFFNGMHRFIPNMVVLLNGSVKQVPVQHFPRFAGDAKYNLANRMVGPFVDSLIFRWMQRNIIRYSIKMLDHEAVDHGELVR